MALSSGQVVEVMVRPDVPGWGGGVDAGEGVQGLEEVCHWGGCEVGEPGGGGAAGAVGGEEMFGGGAGVCRFEGVEVGWLVVDGNGDGV